MNDSGNAGVDVRAGEVVFREGDSGQTMYIIESGAVDIVLAAHGAEPLATLGPGDFFGEMAMLEDVPRFAGAIARENGRLLRIERAEFADLLRQNIEIAVRIMRGLAARHRRSEALLAQARNEITTLRGGRGAAPSVPGRKSAEVRTATSIAIPEAPVELPVPGVAVLPGTASAPPASRTYVLRRADGQLLDLDPSRIEYQVGRPDAAAGITPDIDLSGVDPTRSLSRRHAKLIRRGDLYFVREEVGTVNGTFVNGARVRTGVDVPAMPGDTLRFGAVEVEFVAA